MNYYTKEYKQHFLATEVMGWKVSTGSANCYLEETETHINIMEHWQPFTDIAQVFMLLKNMKFLLTTTNDGLACIVFIKRSDGVINLSSLGTGDTASEAICEAVLRSSGYYKES